MSVIYFNLFIYNNHSFQYCLCIFIIISVKKLYSNRTHEEFIGLYEIPVKDTLLRLNLSFSKARGQCYDGASNMSGVRTGVAKRIIDEEPKAFYTHCYGHSLNLAVSDTMKN